MPVEGKISSSNTTNTTNTNNIINSLAIDTDNEIYTWRRGRNFKSIEPIETIKTDKITEKEETNKSTEITYSNANQETKPKLSLSDEWGGIRGKNKLEPKIRNIQNKYNK